MQTISGLHNIISRYDVLIIDLWGVIHDGSQLYPGVHNALTQLRGAGKKVIMLSNAPRRARKVETVLNALGIEPELYDVVFSSGEAGFRWIENGSAPWGKRFYYIGPEGTREWTDADILDGLDYQRVHDLKDADFLLNVGFGSEAQSSENISPLLQAARALNLPMLCLNPDMEVIKITGERFPCAGVIGRAYEQLGGDVTWFGKPYAAVYEECLRLLQGPHPSSLPEGEGISKRRILAIGDGLETDILGANRFGIDSVLISGGILKNLSPQEISQRSVQTGAAPSYVMPRLAW